MAQFLVYWAPSMFEALHMRQTLDLIQRSRELLAASSSADGFADRKTQEPFPFEQEPMDSASIQSEPESNRRSS